MSGSLLCPSCRQGGFSVRVTSQRDAEVWEGELVCGHCGREYGIKEGIVGLLCDPSPEVVREKKAFNALRSGVPSCGNTPEGLRETILSLPMLESGDMPDGDIKTWRRHGSEAFSICAGVDWKDKAVLELGAGRCWLTAHLVRQGARAVAVDILEDEVMGLGCGRFFLEEGLYFERVICDMHHLPFRDGSFDAVAATATLHHSPFPDALLREVRRVLKPDGILVAANEPLYVPWRETPEEERKGAHEGAYTLWSWLRQLRRNGFRVTGLIAGEGLVASISFRAVISEKGAGIRAPGLAVGFARYLLILLIAPIQVVRRKARRLAVERPMRPLPPQKTAWLRARLQPGSLEETAAAGSRCNWGPGWYPAEGEGQPFRWSSPRALILLPRMEDAGSLVLELATFHPSPWSEPVELEVRIGGKTAGSVLIERHGWRSYRFVPPPLRGKRPVPVLLRVKRGYFRPCEMGLGDDRRLLGVACRAASWETT
jgi:SAM-dependent methyltransferase/uncharacterized protein YbaR (Trm112 family)